MDDRQLLEQGWAAWDARDWPTAARIYEEVAGRRPDDPRTPGLWYDAALAHKFLRDWPRAVELGRRAAGAARPGTGDPVFWNLGIAATALGAWAVARDAWRGYGITQIEPGSAEIEADFGAVCLRLRGPGAEDGEVVWARRICPARARIVSIPMAAAGRRYGEIVLHDGEEVGRRAAGRVSVPVFDELLVWCGSEIPTWKVDVFAPDDDDFQALMDLFSLEDYAAEPQSSMRPLCRCCCPSGAGHETTTTVGAQTMWVAAPRRVADRLLSAWQAFDADRRTIGSLHLVT